MSNPGAGVIGARSGEGARECDVEYTACDARLQSVRDHMRRYRELAAQGKWSEAGRELEAVEAALRQ
jgi:hypothetical protein